MVHQWGFFGSISAIRKIWSLTANSRSLQAAALLRTFKKVVKRHLQRHDQNSRLIVAHYFFFDTLFLHFHKFWRGGGGTFTQMINTRSSLLNVLFRSDYNNENRQCERYTGGTDIKNSLLSKIEGVGGIFQHQSVNAYINIAQKNEREL